MAIREKARKAKPKRVSRPSKKGSRIPEEWRSKLAANPPDNISELGRKLLAIRREIEESGIPLLTEEDIARERAEQRRENRGER